MGTREGVVVISRRAEIDTRAPFRSVKEAVSLFGERVLAGQIYAPKLNQIDDDASNQDNTSYSKLGIMTCELQETKETLEKAKQDTIAMANCLSSLKEELEKTKRELHELKLERESEKQMMEYEMEDLKFVEDPALSEHRLLERRTEHEDVMCYDPSLKADSDIMHDRDHTLDFQERRYVTFANAPFSHVVVPEKSGPFLERHPSLKKKKKQALIPLIGGLFSRKKKSFEVGSVRTP